MISPDTPPGAEVICVDDSAGRYGPSGLARGSVYTVDRICQGIHGEFVAILEEVAPTHTFAEPPFGKVVVGFALRRFRYLSLPDSLTGLLEARRRVAEKILAE